LIIYISQSSVVARFRYGGIFIDRFIANFLESVPVKEFLKSAIFGEGSEKTMVSPFLLTHGVVIFNTSSGIEYILL